MVRFCGSSLFTVDFRFMKNITMLTSEIAITAKKAITATEVNTAISTPDPPSSSDEEEK